MLRLFSLALALALSLAVPPRWAPLVNELMEREKTPDWVVVIDAAQRNTLAYTDADRRRVYIDFAEFRDAPHSLHNTLLHEFAHTKGATHGDGSPYMRYAVTKDASGKVVDDTAVMP